MNKTLSLLLTICSCMTTSNAQTKDSTANIPVDTTKDFIISEEVIVIPEYRELSAEEKANEIHYVCDVMPDYKYGPAALMGKVRSQINYPDFEKKAAISGKVIIRFVVEKDGSISNVEILKKVSAGIDAEAKRVIMTTSGNWIPGKNNNNTVRCYYNMPINFLLD